MSSITGRALPILEHFDNAASHKFATPTKRINDREDLNFFFTSTAYRDLTKWLLQLNRAMFPSKQADGSVTTHITNTTPSTASPRVAKVGSILDDLGTLIEQAPPDTGPRRFGNVAFRKWYQLAEENSVRLLQSHLDGLVPPSLLHDANGHPPALDELNAYLLGSFGSAQRLDYGTGHELSFLAFLGCLWKLGAFEGDEEHAIVTDTIQPYLGLVRKLILAYTLEPAGSHGVWGLDDHSFLPYIFGSAQLGPPIPHSDYSIPVPTEGSLPTAPSPASITNKAVIADFKDSNMYFSAIQFIYDVKKGPFWEHSPVLYDISGIKDGWGKINKGMLKMYAAEVLGKFPVVQHFPFGTFFEWKKDPEAQPLLTSVHAQHQPTSRAHNPETPPASGVGSAAPWARAGGFALPQMQASTGMPSTRAPWAAASVPDRPSDVAVSVGAGTAAPWVGSARNNSNDAARTAAPWARREQGR